MSFSLNFTKLRFVPDDNDTKDNEGFKSGTFTAPVKYKILKGKQIFKFPEEIVSEQEEEVSISKFEKYDQVNLIVFIIFH